MFEASVSITVRKREDGNTVQSQIMTAAPTVADLMTMLGSMLMSNTEILMKDIERQLPKLEAETIKAESVPVPIFDAPDKNYDLWDMYHAVSAGLQVYAVWRERNTNPAMSYVDGVAVAMREQLKPVKTILDGDEAPTYSHVEELYKTTSIKEADDEDSAHN